MNFMGLCIYPVLTDHLISHYARYYCRWFSTGFFSLWFTDRYILLLFLALSSLDQRIGSLTHNPGLFFFLQIETLHSLTAKNFTHVLPDQLCYSLPAAAK